MSVGMHFVAMSRRPVVRVLGISLLMLLLVAVINRGSLPVVLLLPSLTGDQQGASIPETLHRLRIVLHDDVMISLRAALGQATYGRAFLNVSEVSQPATSYLYPLIWAPFSFSDFPWLMPLAACVFGLLCLIGCALIIFRAGFFSRCRFAWLWIVVALLNSSIIQYAYTGWEHLPQAFCLVVSASLLLRLEQQGSLPSTPLLLAAGGFSALAFLFRSDSALLIGPWVMLAAWYACKRSVRWLGFLISSGAPVVAYLVYQWHAYGQLLPTTARLKAGGVLDWAANFVYLGKNVVNGSAVAVTLLCLSLVMKHRNRLTPMLISIAASLVLFSLYGLAVSDVFPNARMFIPASMLGVLAVGAVVTSTSSTEENSSKPPGELVLALILIVIGVLTTIGSDIGRTRVVQPAVRIAHPVVEHTVLAAILRERLDAGRHAVGLFWLGAASYELRGFEVVDFLGKGDEQIASLPVRWGPPGHNKWDIALSVRRWNPAVIIARDDVARMPKQLRQEALAAHEPWTFWEALYEDEAVVHRYRYCMPRVAREFGLLIRLDLVDRFADLCEPRGAK